MHVERVRALYAALAARDLAALLAPLHPDVVVRQSDALPWGGEFYGSDGFARFFKRVSEALDSEVQLERLIDAGDTVVACGVTRGVIRATGARFEAGLAHVYRFEGERIIAATLYVDGPAFVSS